MTLDLKLREELATLELGIFERVKKARVPNFEAERAKFEKDMKKASGNPECVTAFVLCLLTRPNELTEIDQLLFCFCFTSKWAHRDGPSFAMDVACKYGWWGCWLHFDTGEGLHAGALSACVCLCVPVFVCVWGGGQC
jgi:hypothetical protein